MTTVSMTPNFFKAGFMAIFAMIAVALSACQKDESFWKPIEKAPVKEDPKPINPDDFTGCKHECLKSSMYCVRMGISVFGEYQKDLENLFIRASQIPTGEESQVNISENPIMRMEYFTISEAKGLSVKQSDVNDPDLEILTTNGAELPIFKFKSNAIDADYGGPISRIQFHNGHPIFTTGRDRCVGAY